MADDRYIMVRLDRTTHARLCAVRDSMMVGVDEGKVEFEVDSRDRVSLDQVICRLMDKREGQKKRNAAYRARKRCPEPSQEG